MMSEPVVVTDDCIDQQPIITIHKNDTDHTISANENTVAPEPILAIDLYNNNNPELNAIKLDSHELNYDISNECDDTDILHDDYMVAKELDDELNTELINDMNQFDAVHTHSHDDTQSYDVPYEVIEGTRRDEINRLKTAYAPQVADITHFTDAYKQEKQQLTTAQLHHKLQCKGIQFRNLTCPRLKITNCADGSAFYTIGSYVYSEPPWKIASQSKQSNKQKLSSASIVPDGSDRSTVQDSESTDQYLLHSIHSFTDTHFAHYGIGISMYYKLIRHLIWLFLLMSIISLPSLLLNYQAAPTSTSISGYYIEKVSLGNFGYIQGLNQTYHGFTFDSTSDTNPQTYTKSDQLWLISGTDALNTVIFLCFVAYTLVQHIHESRLYHADEVTIAQYTVQVTNLPQSIDRVQLHEYFCRFGHIVDVVVLHNNIELLMLYDQRGKLQRQLKSLRDHDVDDVHIRTAQHKIDLVDEQITSYNQRKQSDQLHDIPLVAWVTFSTINEAQFCIQQYNKQYYKLNTQFIIGKHRLYISTPMEPSNCIYSNYQYSPFNKLARRTFTLLVYVILLAVTVVSVYFATRAENYVSTSTCASNITLTQAKSSIELLGCYCAENTQLIFSDSSTFELCATYLPEYIKQHGYLLAGVFTIISINYILNICTYWLSELEKHQSISTLEKSMTVKLSIGLFLNTGIIITIVNANFQRYMSFNLPLAGKISDFDLTWYSTVGVSLTLTMVANIIYPTVLPLFIWLLSSCRRSCCIARQSRLSDIHRIYSGHQFQLSQRYAYLLNTIFVCMLYSSGIPLMMPVACLHFIAVYWIDKISFLRVYSTPPRYDQTLAVLTVQLLPVAAIIHCCIGIWCYSSPIMQYSDPVPNNDWDMTPYLSYQQRIVIREIWPISLLLISIITLYATIYLLRLTGRFRYHFKGTQHTTLSYWQAAQSVSLESYHLHRHIQYQDAFIRTKSQRQLRPQRNVNKLIQQLNTSMQQHQHQQAIQQQQQHEQYMSKLATQPSLLTGLPQHANYVQQQNRYVSPKPVLNNTQPQWVATG